MKARMCRLAVAATLGLAGCRSDFSQQLLERELRYQEDQIYQLQDDLQDKCTRLDRLAGENASLRRQLGIADGAPTGRTPPARSRPAMTSPPVIVPPARSVPEGAPATLAPPALEGIPPLPRNGGAAAPPAVPTQPMAGPGTGDDGMLALPAPVNIDPTARPAADRPANPVGRSMSYEAPLPTGGAAVRLMINTALTRCVDTDADGTSDGLAIVFEPRDADERLVAAAGDVTITVCDAAAGADPATGEAAVIARWQIAAAEAAGHFRPTTRERGMQFSLPWPAAPPAGDHVRVTVRLAVPGAAPLEADATVPAR